MKKRWKILIGLAVALFLVVTSFEMIARMAIENAGSRALGSDLSLSSVSWNLIAGNMTLRDLTIENPEGFDGDMLRVKEIKIENASLFAKPAMIEKITVDMPIIAYEMQNSGSNFTAMSKAQKEAAAGKTGDTTPESEKTKIAINHIVIENGLVKAAIGGSEGVKSDIALPTIVIDNLGSKDQPVTIDVAIQEIFQNILGKSQTSLAKAQLGNIVDKAKENLDGLKSNIDGLFK